MLCGVVLPIRHKKIWRRTCRGGDPGKTKNVRKLGGGVWEPCQIQGKCRAWNKSGAEACVGEGVEIFCKGRKSKMKSRVGARDGYKSDRIILVGVGGLGGGWAF